MTSYHTQFLYVSDSYGRPAEVINGARTSMALEVSANASPVFSPIAEDGGCPALLFEPCTMDADGVSVAWEPIPTTAPWFIGDVAGTYTFAPEDSEQALGFYITEWTGLDGAHHTRGQTSLGRGGAAFSAQSHRERVMKLNVLLLGLTERSLDYLFHWLESILLGCCEGEQDIWVRETCPGSTASDADLERGLVRMRDVALIEGPTWEQPPVPHAGCFLRMVSFTLAAGDPCKYAVPGAISSTTGLRSITGAGTVEDGVLTTPDTFDGTANRLCVVAEFPEVGRGGVVVSISSPLEADAEGHRRPLPDLRIAGYSQPTGSGCDVSNAVLLGELVISGEASSGLEIEVDVAARRVRARDRFANGAWEDASWLIATTDSGNRRWWSFGPADQARVVVEPMYQFLDSTTETLVVDGLIVSEWTVSARSIHFRGCC